MLTLTRHARGHPVHPVHTSAGSNQNAAPAGRAAPAATRLEVNAPPWHTGATRPLLLAAGCDDRPQHPWVSSMGSPSQPIGSLHSKSNSQARISTGHAA